MHPRTPASTISRVILVVQVDAGFQTAKGLRDFVDDAVNQLVEIENRRDSLRGLLHALQVIDKIGGQRTDVDESRCRRHWEA